MERVERINGCKIELGRCTEEELYAMASDAMLRSEVAEREVSLISEELRARRHNTFMGEYTEELTGERD